MEAGEFAICSNKIEEEKAHSEQSTLGVKVFCARTPKIVLFQLEWASIFKLFHGSLNYTNGSKF